MNNSGNQSRSKILTKKQAECISLRIEGHRCVSVGKTKDGKIVIQFRTPIDKTDFNNGEVMPRANGERRKGKLLTTILISEEAKNALRLLLNQIE